MGIESSDTYSSHYESPVNPDPNSDAGLRIKRKDTYDYVIVGGRGVAGAAAIRTLLQSGSVKPSDILCIDPVGGDCGGVHVAQTECTGLNVQTRHLSLADKSQVRYKQCLIATGKIPSSLVLTEHAIRDRLGILEAFIEPTLLLGKRVATQEAHTAPATQAPQPIRFLETGGPGGTTVTGAQIQALHAQVASGKHVTLAGDCSSDAALLDLALSLAQTAATASSLVPANAKPPTRVTLLCATSGVLSQRVPRHFSQACTRRLRATGIEVVPFAQIRYVSETKNVLADDTIAATTAGGANAATTSTVYLAHTYDHLQTASFETDTLAFHNAETGRQIEHFAISSGDLEAGADGGIAANKSMQAAAGVYVAGEIANVSVGSSRHRTGTHVLGRGCMTGMDHALRSAEIAARNMLSAAAMYGDSTASASEMSCHLYDHLPAYEWAVPAAHIHLSLIGQCSSALETHSFFWKVSSGRPASAQVSPPPSKNGTFARPISATPPPQLPCAANEEGHDDLDSIADRDISDADSVNNAAKESQYIPVAADINIIASNANDDLKKRLLSYFGMKAGDEPVMNYGMLPLVVKGKHSSGGSSAASAGTAATAGLSKVGRVSNSHTATSSSSTITNKKSARKEPKEPMQVPIGLGAIMYVNDENVIAGVGICGLPSTNSKIASEVQARARACIGMSLAELSGADSLPSDGGSQAQKQMSQNPNSNTDSRSKPSPVAILEGMCKVILGPAVGVSDPLRVSHLPKPTHRRVAASSMVMREHYNHQINLLQTPSLTVLKDVTLSNSAKSRVKDRLAAAYSKQITGN